MYFKIAIPVLTEQEKRSINYEIYNNVFYENYQDYSNPIHVIHVIHVGVLSLSKNQHFDIYILEYRYFSNEFNRLFSMNKYYLIIFKWRFL